MEELIHVTNDKLREIIDNLETIKKEYEKKEQENKDSIKNELNKVKEYKNQFFEAKSKIEKMNNDISGFEEDYQNLVDRFKDDELANILVAANKEISAKIEERKQKILRDRDSMNELVEKAEEVKEKLVILTEEKKALEQCLSSINDAYTFYSESLYEIINYSSNNINNLCKEEVNEEIIDEDELLEDDEDNEEINIDNFEIGDIEENELEEEIIVESNLNDEELVETDLNIDNDQDNENNEQDNEEIEEENINEENEFKDFEDKFNLESFLDFDDDLLEDDDL